MNSNYQKNIKCGFPTSSCRVCLERTQSSLISIKNNVDATLTICDLIEYCTGVKVCPNDSYPQFVCEYCFKMLQVAFRVKGHCIYSDQILKSTKTDDNNNNNNNNTNANTSNDETLSQPLDISTCSSTPSSLSDSDKSLSTSKSGDDSLEISFICNKCNISFKSFEELNGHLTSHTTRRIQRKPENQCSVCSTTFTSRTLMINHKKLEHPDVWNQNSCEICGKCFASKMILNQHKNVVHYNIKKYFCHICDMRFGQKSQLNRHNCT